MSGHISGFFKWKKVVRLLGQEKALRATGVAPSKHKPPNSIQY
jgi:hypothetical protein